MNDVRGSIEVNTLGLSMTFGSGINSIELFKDLDGKELKEEHAGIGADQRGGLHRPQVAADLRAVWGSVVLHLLARLEVIFSDGLLGLVADMFPSPILLWNG